MSNRVERERELIQSGLASTIKRMYYNAGNRSIPDKYILLMADYIDCVLQVEDSINISAKDLALKLPSVLESVKEANMPNYGVTDKKVITMNSNLSYEQTKLYFFHELTHALQTRLTPNGEECSFANNKNGGFLMEGLTQYTAECFYHISNGTNLSFRNQPGCVRGQSQYTCYSPLSTYQLNGNILRMVGLITNVGINKMIGLGFSKNCREVIKDRYDRVAKSGKHGNVYLMDNLMDDLEKIYAIDKFMAVGRGDVVSGEERLIILANGDTFMGNLEVQDELIQKVERQLAGNFIGIEDEQYVFEHYQEFSNMLTTPVVKEQFSLAIQELRNIYSASGRSENNNSRL